MFLVTKLGYTNEQIQLLRQDYNRKYGSNLMGLVLKDDVNSKYYLDYIHDFEDCYLPKKDDRLNNLLSNLKMRKIIITNSYKKHANRILEILGVADKFEKVFDILNLGFLYKKFAVPYRKILKFMNYMPSNEVIFDDLCENLISTPGVGMRAVLVGKEKNSIF